MVQKQAGRDNLPAHNRAQVKSDGNHLLDGFKLKAFNLAAAAVPLSLVKGREPDVRCGPKLDHLGPGWGVQNATKPFPVFGFNFFCSLLSSHYEYQRPAFRVVNVSVFQADYETICFCVTF